MHCPVDDSPLISAQLGGCDVHRCAQCSGVAVNGNLLREVRAYAALKLHREHGDVVNAWHCPTDGKAMKVLAYKGIDMCACPQCLGLWLEADQLSRLMELVRPPKQADLSKIGQGLTTIRGSATGSDIAGLGDILEFSVDVVDVIGKVAD
jgi:Zn-finger nucleic acid-binding protein